MQPTGDRADGTIGGAAWQPPLEADPADAAEQTRDMIDEDGDPEAPATSREAGRAGDDLLARASEADLAEQLSEVGYDDFDDDGGR